MRGSKTARFTWIRKAADLRFGCLAGDIFFRTVSAPERRDKLVALTEAAAERAVQSWRLAINSNQVHAFSGITVNDVIERFRLKELIDKGENGSAWATRDRDENKSRPRSIAALAGAGNADATRNVMTHC